MCTSKSRCSSRATNSSNNRERISATGNYEEAILKTDVTFIIVPTPSGPDGRFSMQYVLSAAEQIGALPVAAVRVRPAHRDYNRTMPRPEEWLLIEWPKGEPEPTKYWLSTLPARMSRRALCETPANSRCSATTVDALAFA